MALHLICLIENHLSDHEIDVTSIPKHTLGAKYCRKKVKNGGVCIYLHDTLKFININHQKYCKEQDIEIAAIQMDLIKKKVIIVTV